jgi:hypothetical protein
MLSPRNIGVSPRNNRNRSVHFKRGGAKGMNSTQRPDSQSSPGLRNLRDNLKNSPMLSPRYVIYGDNDEYHSSDTSSIREIKKKRRKKARDTYRYQMGAKPGKEEETKSNPFHKIFIDGQVDNDGIALTGR